MQILSDEDFDLLIVDIYERYMSYEDLKNISFHSFIPLELKGNYEDK